MPHYRGTWRSLQCRKQAPPVLCPQLFPWKCQAVGPGPWFPSSHHLLESQELPSTAEEAVSSLCFPISDTWLHTCLWDSSRAPSWRGRALSAKRASKRSQELAALCPALMQQPGSSQAPPFPGVSSLPTPGPTSKASPQRGPDILANNVACLPDRLSAFFSSQRKELPLGASNPRVNR